MNQQNIVTTKNKGQCIQVVGDDMEGISNMIITAYKNLKGRPAEYEDSEQGLEKFRTKTIEFFEHIAEINKQSGLEKGLIPDIELWASWLGVTRTTIHSYENKRGLAWRDTIQMIKNMIASYKKQAALTYKIPPMIAAFDFCNNHGYHNTSEFKITAEPNNAEQKQRLAIDEELRQNGLRWNEDTKSFEPM